VGLGSVGERARRRRRTNDERPSQNGDVTVIFFFFAFRQRVGARSSTAAAAAVNESVLSGYACILFGGAAPITSPHEMVTTGPLPKVTGLPDSKRAQLERQRKMTMSQRREVGVFRPPPPPHTTFLTF